MTLDTRSSILDAAGPFVDLLSNTLVLKGFHLSSRRSRRLTQILSHWLICVICVICGQTWVDVWIAYRVSSSEHPGWSGESYNPVMVHRSQRIPADLSLNRLAEARARIGEIPYDLTVSNPTTCGFPRAPDLLASLADPRGLEYEPYPRGATAARRTVAALYEEWGATLDPEHIVLTASTSEAYGFLFRLFCDPGQAVLVPSPSYPLFEHLARLEGIATATYNLDADAAWQIDFPSLEQGPAGAKAVIVVHPNNPTGSYVHPEDRERLVALCRDRGWALIADEVFLPYPLEGGPGAETSFVTVEDCLCCTLGGLSKSLGMPQLKLAWTVIGGPDEIVETVLEGLDYVADAYLSVATPTALALPSLLVAGAPVREAIADRCRANLDILRDLSSDLSAVSLAPIGGGWNAVLRVPNVVGDEDLCLRLLEDRGVGVHPGDFFGLADGWLVVSLLPPVDIFAEGIRQLLAAVAEFITPRYG
jgi:aspartate/methionine/tyrosine aminotransferase